MLAGHGILLRVLMAKIAEHKRFQQASWMIGCGATTAGEAVVVGVCGAIRFATSVTSVKVTSMTSNASKNAQWALEASNDVSHQL